MFLVALCKEKLIIEKKSASVKNPMAANVGVWNLVSCKILAMVATFPVMPRHAITTDV